MGLAGRGHQPHRIVARQQPRRGGEQHRKRRGQRQQPEQQRAVRQGWARLDHRRRDQPRGHRLIRRHHQPRALLQRQQFVEAAAEEHVALARDAALERRDAARRLVGEVGAHLRLGEAVQPSQHRQRQRGVAMGDLDRPGHRGEGLRDREVAREPGQHVVGIRVALGAEQRPQRRAGARAAAFGQGLQDARLGRQHPRRLGAPQRAEIDGEVSARPGVEQPARREGRGREQRGDGEGGRLRRRHHRLGDMGARREQHHRRAGGPKRRHRREQQHAPAPQRGEQQRQRHHATAITLTRRETGAAARASSTSAGSVTP